MIKKKAKRTLYNISLLIVYPIGRIAAALYLSKWLDDFIGSLCIKYSNLWLTRALNIFRLLNIPNLSVRPGVVIGLINDDVFPNFQTKALLNNCLAVSITTKKEFPKHIDRLFFDSSKNTLGSVLNSLPNGFIPKFYWDQKIGGASYPLPGIENLPFMTIATIGHNRKALEVENFCELYDVILPLTAELADIYKRRFNNRVSGSIPLGLNWGSFHDFIKYKPIREKTIDVLVSFGPTYDPADYGQRNIILELIKTFEIKYKGKFSVKCIYNLGKKKYFEYLSESRIVLNAAPFPSPYNYRYFESVAAGAVVFQFDKQRFKPDPGCSHYFYNGDQIVYFDENNFENLLLKYLNNNTLISRVSHSAIQNVKSNYSYSKLYKNLLCLALSEDINQIGAVSRRVRHKKLDENLVAGLYHSDDPNKNKLGWKLVNNNGYLSGRDTRSLYIAFRVYIKKYQFIIKCGDRFENINDHDFSVGLSDCSFLTTVDLWNLFISNIFCERVFIDKHVKLLSTKIEALNSNDITKNILFISPCIQGMPNYEELKTIKFNLFDRSVVNGVSGDITYHTKQLMLESIKILKNSKLVKKI